MLSKKYTEGTALTEDGIYLSILVASFFGAVPTVYLCVLVSRRVFPVCTRQSACFLLQDLCGDDHEGSLDVNAATTFAERSTHRHPQWRTNLQELILARFAHECLVPSPIPSLKILLVLQVELPEEIEGITEMGGRGGSSMGGRRGSRGGAYGGGGFRGEGRGNQGRGGGYYQVRQSRVGFLEPGSVAV